MILSAPEMEVVYIGTAAVNFPAPVLLWIPAPAASLEAERLQGDKGE